MFFFGMSDSAILRLPSLILLFYYENFITHLQLNELYFSVELAADLFLCLKLQLRTFFTVLSLTVFHIQHYLSLFYYSEQGEGDAHFKHFKHFKHSKQIMVIKNRRPNRRRGQTQFQEYNIVNYIFKINGDLVQTLSYMCMGTIRQSNINTTKNTKNIK